MSGAYPLDPQQWVQHLVRVNGYLDGCVLPDGERYAVLVPKIYTTAIAVGQIGNENWYDDFWCYPTSLAAAAALNIWDGTGEPIGWIRHAPTGRRVSTTGDEVDEHGNVVGAPGVLYVRP